MWKQVHERMRPTKHKIMKQTTQTLHMYKRSKINDDDQVNMIIGCG